jgi:hypothetical protein
MSDQFSPRLATGWPGVSPDLCGSWTEGLFRIGIGSATWIAGTWRVYRS